MGRYLSNNTMGSMWMQDWCENCTHDHGMHNAGDRDGCPIVVATMVDEYPIDELTEVDHDDVHRGWGSCCLTCSKFEPCTACDIDPTYDPRSTA